jgi:FMN phosphatase YigB (HAD superfamily)
MQNIKAILFDLDGTLSQSLPAGGEVFVEYVRSLGLRISEEDRIRAIHWEHFYFARSIEIQADRKTYKGDEKAFWVNFAKRRLVALGISTAEAVELAPKVSAYMAESHKPVSFVPEGAFTLLQSLKTAGYILGLVSNREKPYGEKLKELKLDSYFKFTLASVEVNSFKPDRVIFERALELAGASAPETMYVGDNYFADVVGARRVGIIPVLYDPTRLFPDAECAVIRSFGEFAELLK